MSRNVVSVVRVRACGWARSAWTRLLGLRDDPDLQDADPETLRPDLAHPCPPGPPRPPAQPENQPGLTLEGHIPRLLAAALRPASTRLTSTSIPATGKEPQPGAVGAGAHPGTPGSIARWPLESKQTARPKPGASTISNQTSGTLND